MIWLKKGSILFQMRNSNEWITSVAGPDHIVADLDSRDKKFKLKTPVMAC